MAISKNISLLHIFVFIRFVMAILSTSYHHGDETYQSVEVAHYLVFGRGHLTWEWTTENPIRSYLHPLMFAVVFKVLKILSIDSTELVVLMPRVLQGMISAYSDLYILKFFLLYFGSKGRKWFLLAYIMNSSLLYYMSRTLVNSLEAALGNIALYFYAISVMKLSPQKTNKDDRADRKVFPEAINESLSRTNDNSVNNKCNREEAIGTRSEISYVALITISFILRATTAILWIPLVSFHIFLMYRRRKVYDLLVKKLIPIAMVLILVSTFIDSVCHGKFVVVHWNFFSLNLLVDVSSQCGVQPRYMYFLIGMWTVNFVGLFLFPGLYKAWKNVPEFRVYVIAAICAFCILSMIGHKEVRFWIPYVPLCLCVSAYYMQDCTFVLQNKKLISGLTIFFNLFIVCYESFFVQFGANNVTSFLSQDIKRLQTGSNALEASTALSVLFMTHCHSTPLHSHIHEDVPIDIATCPLITSIDWKKIKDKRRREIWLNDDTSLLTEWPHLYLYKYFRYPINETEIQVDDSYQKFIQNMWTTVYVPDSTLKPIECNLTEKIIETSKDIKVYGIDRPMPSHIVTLQGGDKEVFHPFLAKQGYAVVKKFAHSSVFIFSENSDMQYHIYKKYK